MSILPATYCEGFHDEAAIRKMKYQRLGNTDMMVSAISFGAGPLGNLYRKTDDVESQRVVNLAMKQGINMIDTAPWYGQGRSETTLGKVLCDVPRKAYYLNTKVGRYEKTFGKMFNFTAERVTASVDESLSKLQTDHIDVVQVHDMEFAPSLDMIINETLPALEKLKSSGKVRHIGITGYPMESFKYVIENSSVKIDSILTYCRGSMNDYILKDYMSFFKEKNVGVINASILSMGLLTNRGPPAWHPAPDDIKTACKLSAEYCQSKDVDISKIASDYAFKLPGVGSTLIGTASCTNLQKNLDVFFDGLNNNEQIVQDYVMKTYFEPIPKKHWEGVEIEKYQTALKEGRDDGRL